MSADITATNFGEGKHEKDIPFQDLEPFFKLQFGSLITYQAAISLTKISLCVMYLRIFGMQKFSNIFLWIVNAISIASLIGLELTSILQCNPIKAVWDLTVHGKCIDTSKSFWCSVVISVVTDVALLCFSAWQIKGLQMRFRQKVVLLCTVGLGWVVVLAAVIRAVRIAAVLKDASDASWRTYDTSIWSAVEINVGLLCTSAPAIKPLLQKLAPKFMYSISGPTGSATRGGTSGRRTHNFTATASHVPMQSMSRLVDDHDKDKERSEGGIIKSTQVVVTDHELV